MLTAAHCLFKDGEQVAAKTLSILLGLHDRSKTSELNRCIELNREMSSALIVVICCRKKVRVDEIILHENFTTTGSKANDIALLRLGIKEFLSTKEDMRPNLFGPFSKKTFILNYSFRGKG